MKIKMTGQELREEMRAVARGERPAPARPTPAAPSIAPIQPLQGLCTASQWVRGELASGTPANRDLLQTVRARMTDEVAPIEVAIEDL
jgi:hypothetical protein